MVGLFIFVAFFSSLWMRFLELVELIYVSFFYKSRMEDDPFVKRLRTTGAEKPDILQDSVLDPPT